MAQHSENPTSDSLNETMRSAAEGLKETGQQAMEGAKSVMGNAMSELRAGASAKAEEMRGSIAEEGQRMAYSLREAAGQGGGGVQARVLETMASGVEAVSDQIAARDVSGLIDDVTAFARRNPAVFIAGAAVAGLMLARMAAKAAPSQSGMSSGMPQGYGRSGPQAGDMGAGLEQGGMAGDEGDFDPSRGPSMGGAL